MCREHKYYLYILTNWNYKVMYIGMTNNFPRRVWEHKNHLVKGLTIIYNVHKVVYIEEISEVTTAIAREKELKKWRRKKTRNNVGVKGVVIIGVKLTSFMELRTTLGTNVGQVLRKTDSVLNYIKSGVC